VTVRGTPERQIRLALGRGFAGYRSAVPRGNTLAPEYIADVWVADESEAASLIESAVAGAAAQVVAVTPTAD